MDKCLLKIHNNKWFWRLWLLAILVLFCLTRFWKINTLPSGLYVDEAGMAYDAWCLSEYGVDRYLKSWPVYLINFDGGQSCMYAFLTAFLFKMFGYSKLMIRLPGILFSFMTLVFGMKIVKKLYPENKLYSYVYGSIVVSAPYFIMASRFGLDCNLMLGMSTLFLYVFVCAMETGKTVHYFLAGIAGGLVFYTYILSYLTLPLFLVMSFIYVLWSGKFNLKKWLTMMVPMGVLALPLIMVQIINIFDLPEMQWGIFTITKLPFYRGQELGVPKWENLITALTCIFQGDDRNYDSIWGIPVLYGIVNILFVIGFWQRGQILINKCTEKIHELYMYIFLWFISMIIMGTVTEMRVYRINAIYAVTVMIALYGLKTMLDIRGNYGRVLAIVLITCYLINFYNFGDYYYRGQYAADNEPLRKFNDPIMEAYEFIIENPNICNKPTQMAQRDIYYAVSALPSPYEYKNGANTGNVLCGGLGTIEDTYNYIVEDDYVEYSQDLRNAGFIENKYNGYSLFYKE